MKHTYIKTYKENNKMLIEEMSNFFTVRVDGYDEHMIKNVEGCKEGYMKMAQLIPNEINDLLDLGCGTGLELDEIFKIKPLINVTGIDLTKAMLYKLKQKHPDKNLSLINASYLDYDFGVNEYDVAISFQTLHHLSHKEKLKLYKKVFNALKTNGKYIECDYMVESQQEENFYFNENKRIRKEQNIPDGQFYHYDTPCTIDNQIKLLAEAGFKAVSMNWRMGNTTIIIAKK